MKHQMLEGNDLLPVGEYFWPLQILEILCRPVVMRLSILVVFRLPRPGKQRDVLVKETTYNILHKVPRQGYLTLALRHTLLLYSCLNMN